MAGISINMDGSNVGGQLDLGDDMRGVSLRDATIGVFHAEGKKLTLEFLQGARFGQLTADYTTEFYTQEGQRLPSGAVSVGRDAEGFFFERHTI